MPATQTDQDHRTDYAAGGLTVDQKNLDPECRHDHRLQHDGGWIVYRPSDSHPLTGSIVWISPLGHRYESRPPPVLQLYPEPGNHYPCHDIELERFGRFVEQIKSRANANENEGEDSGTAGSAVLGHRSSRPFPDVPPF